MSVKDLGRAIPLHKGSYDNDTTYELNDLVDYQDSTYWHIGSTATQGVKPTNTNTWRLVILDGTAARTYASEAEAAAQMAQSASALAQVHVGAPLTASTVSAMTDTSRIYVYVGSESGYTNGDWYYYNGLTWVSGGVYNSTAFVTDTTLLLEGAAADAKTTGDTIRLSTSGMIGSDVIEWEVGGINASGANLSSSSRLRTTDYIPENITRLYVPSGDYEFAVYAYDENDTFVGSWTGWDLVSGVTASFHTSVSLAELGDYSFRIVLRDKADTTAALVITDADNIVMYATNADESLSIAGAYADAKMTGDAIQRGQYAEEHIRQNMFSVERSPSTSSGLFTLTDKSLNIITGLLTSTSATLGCHTNCISVSGDCCATLGLADYVWTCFSYKGGEIASSSEPTNQTEGQYVSGSNPIYVTLDDDYTHIAIGFRRVDMAAMTTDLTDMSSDYYRIQHALHVWIKATPDTTLTLSGEAADAKVAGDAIAALNDTVRYTIDISNFSWSYGGVAANGKNLSYDTRLRLLGQNGSGGITVSAGSSISANSGYKFCVALYSAYQDASNNTLIDYRSMGAGSYTISEDCIIRIAIGTTGDDVLWTEDGEGVRTLTAEGVAAAENALTLNLYGGTVKQEIENLKAGTEEASRVLELSDEIPLNAVDYHALWDNMVGSGYVDRELLANINDDETLPMYLYTMRSFPHHMASNYDLVAYSAFNTSSVANAWRTSVDLSEIGDYQFKVVLNSTDGETAMNTTMSDSLKFMDKNGNDVVVDGWELGTFVAKTGATSASSKRIRTTDYLPSEVATITLTSASYKFAIYAWTQDNDYLGIWARDNRLYQKPKALITAGIHGCERAMPVVAWDFARHLATDREYQTLRDTFDWYFIPLCNPWGFGHTAILTSTIGDTKPTYGITSYTKDTAEDYTVEDNTSTMHYGIRRNLAGYDCNRDFYDEDYVYSGLTYGFKTQEAQLIKSTIDRLTADGVDFAFAIDCHQAQCSETASTTGADDVGEMVNNVSAFLSVSYEATDEDKAFVYGKFMNAAAETIYDLSVWSDKEERQTIYPWDGTSAKTMRNYLHDYADYAMCFEGGQTCAYYSGLTGTANWSNEICRDVVNTQFQAFLRKLGEHWSDVTGDNERQEAAEYYVGPTREYTSLTRLFLDLAYDTSEKTIYVDPGEYDIFAEYRAIGVLSPITGTSTNTYEPYCVYVPPNTRLIGLGNVTLKWDPAASDITELESQIWSPLNVRGNVEVENITVLCNNGRYCLHDDPQGNSNSGTRHIYRNCSFVRNVKTISVTSFVQVIGMGYTDNSYYEFDGCTFENHLTGSLNYCAGGHEGATNNGWNDSANKGPLVIYKNCVMTTQYGTNAMRFQTINTTDQQRIRVQILGCYLSGNVWLDQYTSNSKQFFDLLLLKSGNPTIQIDIGTDNPYTPQVFQ